jgi:soluble lytic murein transglycosylase-like protein
MEVTYLIDATTAERAEYSSQARLARRFRPKAILPFVFALVLMALVPLSVSAEVYVVKSGDTLSAIARRFNTTVTAIAQANNVANVNLIRVGQRLDIPTAGGTTSSTNKAVKGNWQELPHVKGIPSAYYNAVHRWDSITNYYAKYYQVDPDLIRRIIYIESKGHPNAYRWETGVKGLMQVAPVWFKKGENPYDPRTNIGRGTYILRRGFNTYKTWFKAVTYYCYGAPLGRFGSKLPTFYASLIFTTINRSI